VTDIAALVADNIDVWTGAIQRKSRTGRGGGKRISLYGIERLRALILDLAVRGKLVPQDEGDEPASELLKRIAKSKAAMIRDGVIRKPRAVENKDHLKQPFPIPSTWQWVRLDQVGAIMGGGTPSSNDAACFAESGTAIAWLTPADLSGFTGRYIAHGARDITASGLRSSSATLMPAGSVLFTSRAPIGYVAIAEKSVTTNQGFKSVVPFISDCSLFIATALKSFAKGIYDSAPGTTFKEVSGKIVSAIPFPLPPLAEQRRIVAKVDALMGLCDALERESAGAMAAHQALVEALLATLVNSADAADLARQWARLKSHFDTLFTTGASIDALKQTILDLAMRGKLSEPDNWPQKAERLGAVAKLQNGYAFKSDWFAPDGTRLLRNINISHGHIEWNESVCLPESRAREYGRFQLYEDDVVLTLDRPFISTGTKVAKVVAKDLPSLLLQRVGRFQLTDRICSDFVHLWVCSPLFSGQIDPGRSNGVPHISSRQVEAATIFVPKVAEQRRIVAKVEALMALCEALKARLADAAQTQRHLADAITERAAA
jgi:type I restriction enzyme S subunit